MEVWYINNKSLNLKNDVVFKELFSKKGNEIFLQDFLSGLLNIDIQRIEIQKDSSLSKNVVSEKYGILDIKATLNDDTTVDIEMQVTDYGNMIERALYYSSKLISSQLKSGNDYIQLKPVIVICILNFDIFPFEEYITETVTVSKKHLDYEIIKHQKFYFIELSKFRNNNYDLKEKTNQWLTFIDGMNKKGVEFAMSKNNVIKKAKEELDYLTGNERLQRLAELREKALKDRNSLYNYGHRTGVDEGMKKEKIDIAKTMIKEKFDINIISKITGLTIEEIEAIKD